MPDFPPLGVAAGPETAPEADRVSWTRAFAVLGVTMAILLLATLSGGAAGWLFDAWNGTVEPRAHAAGALEAQTTARLATVLFGFQIAAVALVVFAAWRLARSGLRVLPLAMRHGGAGTVLLSVAGLFVVTGLYGVAVFNVDRTALTQDLSPFAEMMRSQTWWMMLLAAGVGAPIAEEFLFRGLLYGTLKVSPIGAVGAGLVTALSWAMLHANYAIYGIGAIFVIGLYLAWLRERTGSLLAPIVCHGVYNTMIVLALRAAPEIANAPV